jgi:hypothetical protein
LSPSREEKALSLRFDLSRHETSRVEAQTHCEDALGDEMTPALTNNLRVADELRHGALRVVPQGVV